MAEGRRERDERVKISKEEWKRGKVKEWSRRGKGGVTKTKARRKGKGMAEGRRRERDNE